MKKNIADFVGHLYAFIKRVHLYAFIKRVWVWLISSVPKA